MRRLPPLNALKAFEAAARHGSIQAAASELCVTPAAVSQQVRSLERYLGLPLFRRLPRGLALTAEGEVYLQEARHALDRLGAVTEQIVEKKVAGVLRVSAIPSLTTRWLVPRLTRFLDRFPDVTLRLTEDVRPVDFARDPFDLGIRYGPGDYAGLRVDRIMDETLILVAAPSLVTGPPPLRRPADLGHCRLLHEAHGRANEPWLDWQPWLNALGVARDAAADRGPRFNATASMLRAAATGAGVAIGRARLIEDDLASGVLVNLFGQRRVSRSAYWTVSPPEIALLPRVGAFRSWLQAEAATDAAAATG
jgi:LysR family glycine cleavage system transcriptional activator